MDRGKKEGELRPEAGGNEKDMRKGAQEGRLKEARRKRNGST